MAIGPINTVTTNSAEEKTEKRKGLTLRRLEIEPAKNGFVLREILTGKGGMPEEPDMQVFGDVKGLAAYILAELGAHKD
jgi:hypothetical protein